MKPSFLNADKPLLTAMIQLPTAKECIEKINASIEAGADAIGVQLCRLRREYRTKECLTEIFAACKGKPIYVTSYRLGESEGMTDDECGELLLLALECGATLCDVHGDMYDNGAKYQIAQDKEAIEKQKKFIDEIHRRGGEVIVSSHTEQELSVEENLALARAQINVGADVIKIVNIIEKKENLHLQIESIQKIIKMTDKKLLFLVSGEGQQIRYIGPNLGVCMYLCVESYDPLDTPEQPLIRDLKPIRDNMNFNL